jgi:predicted metal-dependent hydrolase
MARPASSAATQHAAEPRALQRPLFDEPGEPDTVGARLAGEVFNHPRAQREVCLDGHRVAYELRHARRRSIGFVVGPDGLSVSAPRWVGAGALERALQDKRGWILRKLREQRERAQRLQAARIVWRDGAVLPFLGAKIVLRLDPAATGAVLEVAPALAHDSAQRGAAPMPCLRLGLPAQASAEQIRDLVQGWLQRQARRVFDERCALFAARLGVRVRRIGLSSAATRWGSASADGSIRLNWRLVHFAMPVVDYVVAHELAHLREMNHSPAFWSLVREVLPDYEHSRCALREGQVPVFD